MENKKFICIRDYQFEEHEQDGSFLFGKVDTIDGWKKFLLKDRINSLTEVFYTTDDEFINEMDEYLRLKGVDVIKRIQDIYDIKIVPFEDKKYQFFIEDTGKFIDEDAVRKMLFNSETNDLYDNYYQFKDNTYNLDYQFNCIKNALKLPIEEVIKTLNASWNIPIKKLY